MGFWSYSDASHPAVAQGDALPQGSTPTSTTTTPNLDSSTVEVVFPAAVTLNGSTTVPPSDYVLTQYPEGGGSSAVVSGSCSGTSSITCLVSGVADGNWTYTDTPVFGSSWSGAESAQGPQVTVDSTPPSGTIAYPASGAVYGGNWSGTISGTASDALSGVMSVSVAIENTTTGKYWGGSSFNQTALTYKAATGTTSWTYALAASKLATGDSYSVVAEVENNVTNTYVTPASTFTYSTAAVTCAITYPVKSTTYGANWTGSIVGTSSSPNTVSTVTLTVENTTTGLWWNGSSFSGTAATSVTATGTTSWTYLLGASTMVSGDGYSVVATATDSIGNHGTSTTVAYTYNTTAPVPSITVPVNGASYGANWPGKLSGTATYTNTASAVTVAIENTTTGYWYNGTNFTTVTSQTFLTASGTTSWSYTLAASKLVTTDSYSVVVDATDKAGNVGQTSTYTFTYNTTVPTAAVSYPVQATYYGPDWSGTISGTATFTNPPSYVTVVIKNVTASLWWNGTSFGATSSTAVTASGTTNWSYALPASDLTSGDKYTVIAHAYDALGNTAASATRTFYYSTALPTSAVTYPVNGTTYTTWAGHVTGTAAATGATVSSVVVALKNTTTGLWWSGTAFTATSQTFVAATGTTSWSYVLATGNLVAGDSYSVVVQVTDSAGNVGTGTAVSFTYT